MSIFDVTYREVDGRRIEGTWRHVFIHNGDTFYLTDLKIYADGLIDCWGLVDLAGFREKLRSGWVATSLPNGAMASAHHLGSWQFQSSTCVSADDLFTEVADEIERLAGRRTSSDRCIEALYRFEETRLEADRQLLAEAYLAVPSQLRMYLLGDQDNKDRPIRAVATRPGEMRIGDRGEPRVVTVDEQTRAFEYLAERKRTRTPRVFEGDS
jgi:hypothetical protein